MEKQKPILFIIPLLSFAFDQILEGCIFNIYARDKDFCEKDLWNIQIPL